MSHAAAELPTLDLLVPVIFDELRAMAHRQLAHEHGPITLQTTELVHEAYLRLASDARVAGLGQAYFYAAAARAMRQVLVDAARRRNAGKRGAGVRMLSLDDQVASVEPGRHGGAVVSSPAHAASSSAGRMSEQVLRMVDSSMKREM